MECRRILPFFLLLALLVLALDVLRLGSAPNVAHVGRDRCAPVSYPINASSEVAPRPTFVTVHLGMSATPRYMYDSLHQLRRRSPDDAVLVLSEVMLSAAAVGECIQYLRSPAELSLWSLGQLASPCYIVNALVGLAEKTSVHKAFAAKFPFRDDGSTFRDGFVEKAALRLFHLHDFLAATDLREVILFEYDNLIFFSYREVAAPLLAAGVKITTTRNGPIYDLANVMWILHEKYLGQVLEYYAGRAGFGNEMEVLSRYQAEQQPGSAGRLPVYWDSIHDPGALFQKFNAIFDAAALGQWAGGVDPRNIPNYVALCCFHNLVGPYNFSGGLHSLVWKEVPPLSFVEPYLREALENSPVKEVRIMNLHIHSKLLKRFMYRRPGTDFIAESGEYVAEGVPPITALRLRAQR